MRICSGFVVMPSFSIVGDLSALIDASIKDSVLAT